MQGFKCFRWIIVLYWVGFFCFYTFIAYICILSHCANCALWSTFSLTVGPRRSDLMHKLDIILRRLLSVYTMLKLQWPKGEGGFYIYQIILDHTRTKIGGGNLRVFGRSSCSENLISLKLSLFFFFFFKSQMPFSTTVTSKPNNRCNYSFNIILHKISPK